MHDPDFAVSSLAISAAKGSDDPIKRADEEEHNNRK